MKTLDIDNLNYRTFPNDFFRRIEEYERYSTEVRVFWELIKHAKIRIIPGVYLSLDDHEVMASECYHCICQLQCLTKLPFYFVTGELYLALVLSKRAHAKIMYVPGLSAIQLTFDLH